MTPDYKNINSITYYGKVSDLPEPHIRRWPHNSTRLRSVSISAASYLSDIGHWYTGITVEPNPLYNADDDCWQVCDDDDDAREKVRYVEMLRPPMLFRVWKQL